MIDWDYIKENAPPRMYEELKAFHEELDALINECDEMAERVRISVPPHEVLKALLIVKEYTEELLQK